MTSFYVESIPKAEIVPNILSITFNFQSFGEDFSDEPNASPFDLFEEMENVETEETHSDPFFETGYSSLKFSTKHAVLALECQLTS